MCVWEALPFDYDDDGVCFAESAHVSNGSTLNALFTSKNRLCDIRVYALNYSSGVCVVEGTVTTNRIGGVVDGNAVALQEPVCSG